VAELISVIVTTFNREDALAAVLRGLSRQRDRDFEVVVADDGSGPSTAALVETWRRKFDVPLWRVWHPHRDFRAGEIRNRAILASSGSYCVFLDGDCIPRPHFVGSHRRLAEPGWFVTGNRVLLSPALTDKVLRENEQPERWTAGRWLAERFRGGVNRPRRCCICRSGRCAACAAKPGKARARATWASGAPISIRSTASTPVTAAGARKTPI
jgi:glycosyltransferase involved in cell wall biosynthesis